MKSAILGLVPLGTAAVVLATCLSAPVRARDWEITPQGEQALARGLEWLARTQGPEGNWQSNDLGLVSTGILAFLSSGHLPGRGRYGENVQRALDYVLRNAKSFGAESYLLNIAESRRAMYNHGLSTFVLGQLYGTSSDTKVGKVLNGALRMICQTQCEDGGWDYVAQRQPNGHDLSLAVMQALALRSAVDSGLEVPPETVELAIKSVREHYTPAGCDWRAPEEVQRAHPGQFTYSRGGGNPTTAMSAAGVVCLQEFAQYDDWRIEKNIELILKRIGELPPNRAISPGAPPALRRLHAVLRRAGVVPGERARLAEGLSETPRCGRRQPNPRAQPTGAGWNVECPWASGWPPWGVVPDGRFLFRPLHSEPLPAHSPGREN